MSSGAPEPESVQLGHGHEVVADTQDGQSCLASDPPPSLTLTRLPLTYFRHLVPTQPLGWLGKGWGN